MTTLRESVWDHVRAGETVESIIAQQKRYQAINASMFDYASWKYLFAPNRTADVVEHVVTQELDVTELRKDACCVESYCIRHEWVIARLRASDRECLNLYYSTHPDYRDSMMRKKGINLYAVRQALSAYTYYAYEGDSVNWSGTHECVCMPTTRHLLYRIASYHLAVVCLCEHYALPAREVSELLSMKMYRVYRALQEGKSQIMEVYKNVSY